MRKRRSIAQRIFMILAVVLALNFAGGCIVLYQLEQANTNYIYQLTGELSHTSILNMEQQLDGIVNILYDIVVSAEVQKAGSAILSESAGNAASTMNYSSNMNWIIDRIQQGIVADHAIVCANFLDGKEMVRVVASTRYYKPDDEIVKQIGALARAWEGKTILLDGTEATGDRNILILAKEVREKKDLSLAHIGVVILFVDMERIGKLLADVHDGVFVLFGQEWELNYVLNDKNGILEECALFSEGNPFSKENVFPEENNYSIQKIGKDKYFVVNFRRPGQMFSYMLLEPYSQLFKDVLQAFWRYAGLLALCGIAAAVLAFFSVHRVTRDIRRFIQHIQRVPGENFTQIPLYEKKDVRDQDVYNLQMAYNSMSTHINELVQDNYMKQLLIKETQLQAMQAQMNPHFLYNTLNSVYWMAKTAKMNAAADMISSLGLLLREAISGKEFVIAMDKELDMVCHYFIIQKHRYEERLEVRFDVSGDCSHLAIPKFTLQPLAENAIAYGLECMIEPCVIEIRIVCEGPDCVCQVRNQGPEPEPDLIHRLKSGSLKPRGNGIGLLNIDSRIRTVYGEEYGVTLYRERDWTVAQVRFGCMTLEEYGSREEEQGSISGETCGFAGGEEFENGR